MSVESIARRMYESMHSGMASNWERANPHKKQQFRRAAGAVLSELREPLV